MDYTITIYKKQGEPLYALWIDLPEVDPQPGTVWEVMQELHLATEEPIPAALCGMLLMSEATNDKLFRDIADTWLGAVENDPLDTYDQYTSQEEATDSLD